MDIFSWTSLLVPNEPFLWRVQVFINTLRSVRYLSAGHSSYLHSTFRAHAAVIGTEQAIKRPLNSHRHKPLRSDRSTPPSPTRGVTVTQPRHITSFSRVGIDFFFARYRSTFGPSEPNRHHACFRTSYHNLRSLIQALDWDSGQSVPAKRGPPMWADTGQYRMLLSYPQLPGLRKAGVAPETPVVCPQNKAGGWAWPSCCLAVISIDPARFSRGMNCLKARYLDVIDWFSRVGLSSLSSLR